jgi:hypothetical protein
VRESRAESLGRKEQEPSDTRLLLLQASFQSIPHPITSFSPPACAKLIIDHPLKLRVLLDFFSSFPFPFFNLASPNDVQAYCASPAVHSITPGSLRLNFWVFFFFLILLFYLILRPIR